MSKTLKKLLCALMAVAMMFAFAACGDEDKGGDDKEEKKTEATASPDPNEVPAEPDEPSEEPEDEDADVEEAVENYINDTLSVLSDDSTLEAMAEAFASMMMGDSYDEAYVEAFIPAAKSYVDVMLDNVTYEIVEYSGDEATVVISMPDTSKFEELGQQLGQEMLSSEIVTEDMTTEEKVEAIVDYLSNAWEDIVDEAGTAESEVTLTITEEDGKLVASE